MTQAQLSQKTGLAVRFIQDIEAGNKQTSITTVFRIADGLDVLPKRLLDSIFETWQLNNNAS